jgi:hypothetical protein
MFLSVGSTNIPQSPTTSGIAVVELDSTGIPDAIASNGGRPNPS